MLEECDIVAISWEAMLPCFSDVPWWKIYWCFPLQSDHWADIIDQGERQRLWGIWSWTWGWRYLPATPSRNLGGAVITIQVQSSHFIPNFERKIHSNTRHNAGWPLGRYYRPLIDNQPFCLNDWYSVLPPYIFWIWCRGVYFFGGRPDNCWL